MQFVGAGSINGQSAFDIVVNMGYKARFDNVVITRQMFVVGF